MADLLELFFIDWRAATWRQWLAGLTAWAVILAILVALFYFL